MSEQKIINREVPQGSVLGPLLYLQGKYTVFADNTIIPYIDITQEIRN